MSKSEVSAERLKSFIERIEKVEEDKAAIAADHKEIYAEAASAGFQTKIIRRIVALRKVALEKRREEAELVEMYASAIGMED